MAKIFDEVQAEVLREEILRLRKLKNFFGKLKDNLLIILLVSIFGSLIASVIIWQSTKDKIEITFRLDSWITVGELAGVDLPNLNILYNNKSVRNVLKISWLIVNTGSKGIEKFEILPSLVYPEALNIVEAIISDKSHLLIIDRALLIDKAKRTVTIKKIGVFNSKEFFKIDVYAIDVPDVAVLKDNLDKWETNVKSVDLQMKKDIKSEIFNQRDKSFNSTKVILLACITLFIIISPLFYLDLQLYRNLTEIFDIFIKPDIIWV